MCLSIVYVFVAKKKQHFDLKIGNPRPIYNLCKKKGFQGRETRKLKIKGNNPKITYLVCYFLFSCITHYYE